MYTPAMSLRRVLTHTLIITYLFLTAYAFFFTMVRQKISIVPEGVLHFFYGMMAPYQGYTTYNFDLLAEGKNEEGQWETINLDPYYPMLLGHQVMYRRLRTFHYEGEEESRHGYTKLAELLRKHEEEKGEIYTSVRLTWQTWPMSPFGWDAMRREEHITSYPLTETPR